MAVDPNKIAKMITEDPDEVNPLDNIEDEFEEELGFCDGCLRSVDYDDLWDCEKCGYWWCEICTGKRSGFNFTGDLADGVDMSSCPNCIT